MREFLKSLELEKETIDVIMKEHGKILTEKKSEVQTLQDKIKEHEETITANINYLKDLGISNYVEAFVRFYNMFLLEPSSFDEIFSKYDKDDLIVKLEKNVAIMEYL